MSNPQLVRFAPGTGPVAPKDQIPDAPADSAEWMSLDPEPYDGGPLFPEEPNVDR